MAFSTVFSFAGSTKSMTVYDEVIKNKDIAYVSASTYVQKFTISSEKWHWSCTGGRGIGKKMKLHKGYLYYALEETNGSKRYQKLYRVNVKTGKESCILKIDMKKKTSISFKYAISGSRIYYNYKLNGLKKKVMKLNGKNKKSSRVTVKNKVKKSNAKGYSVTVESDESGDVYYLKTPSKQFEVVNERESSSDEDEMEE